MTVARAVLSALLLGLITSPLPASASDIDIYSGLTSATGAPNVLIILDNAANFNSNFSGTVCTYTGGGVPSLGGTNPINGSIEQCALNNVIQGVQPNPDGTARINIGIMVYNGSGIPLQGGGTCNGGNGGCLVYPLTPMTAANKAALMTYIQGWTKQAIAANGEATAETMEEAWDYLHGGPTPRPAPSNTAYGSSPITQNGCQKTYVVFIANALGTNGTPGEGGNVTPGADLAATISADAALTAAQKSSLSANIQITSGTYGIKNVYACSPNPYVMGSHTESSGLYADEWAEFMAGTDLFTGGMPPNKSITTYAIGVLSPSCVSTYPALLNSMASAGGGKYYAVQNAADLQNTLVGILNEVQAVNSVFSSATLPVSVNTQGTYLNQLYMGMFRPDPNALPRWLGNVKQYQFAFDQNKNLYLADATGQPAISSSGTGFLSTQAASFWSCANTTQASNLTGPPAPYIPYASLPTCDTDPQVGFWINFTTYANFSAGHAFDLMDGEIVEKGGAGQQLRLDNLTDDYTLPSGTGPTVNASSQTTTGNPRRLYTFCPAGMANCPCTNSTSTTGVVNGNSVCTSLTDPINSFGSDNAALAGSNRFGGMSQATIATLTESGGIVTATTTAATNFASGDTVTISGASPNDYNGTYTISNVSGTTSSTTFTYNITENPPLTATGAYMVQAHQPTLSVSAITRTYTASANPSPNADLETATVTTSSPHGYATGNTVVISGAGANQTAYNGQHTITVTGANTFTFPVTITPPATGTNVYTVSLHNKSPVSITTISLSGSTATVTTSNAHGFYSNDLIQISSTSNTCFQTAGAIITKTSSTTFTISGVSGCGGNKTSTGGFATPVAANQAATMTRTGTTNPATATATLGASNFATNDLVDITYYSGSATNETLYTGTYQIVCSAYPCTTFTYPVATNPVYPGSGSIFVSLTSGAVAVYPYPQVAPNPPGLTRVGNTATANLQTALPAFTSPGLVDVFAQPGTTAPAAENNYQGTFTATCQNSPCTTITYPIQLSPTSPATGNITALDTSKPPIVAPLIDWVRGSDNEGDEYSLCPPPGSNMPAANCPNPAVTVRPSIHGDALHSRPIAVNYGGTTGVVVFYGTNDGVYHAINGNQPPCNPAYSTCPTTTPPSTITDTATGTAVLPGGEIWGFIAPDFYPKLNRQRINTPQILLPGMNTNVPPVPQPKDYFIDGPTGLLQEIDGNGRTVRAVIYIGARRGGHLLYAVDVTDPFHPYVLWKIDNSAPNMGELGQTWSLPKIARVDGYVDASGNAKPVLIMGAGYDDGGEDAEPPISATSNGGGVDMGSDNVGRGIFVLDAFDGHVVWQAHHYNVNPYPYPFIWNRINPATTGGVGGTPNANGTGFQGGWCAGTPPAQVECNVAAMNYSMPADITLMDKDGDGHVDRLYATDTGGNVWRIDLEPSSGITPDKWQITQLAALGCNWGPCDSELWSYPQAATVAPTQRKFFFPAEVIGMTSLNNYDAVFVGSGDREHPLMSSQSYNVVNRMYMIKDFNTTNDAVSQIYPVTEGGSQVNIGSTTAPGSLANCTGGTCITAPSGGYGSVGTATGLTYDKLTAPQQGSGYYFKLAAGEKVVNAPLTTAGFVYFGTNQPVAASTLTTCTTNLGMARGYQLAPFSAQYASVVFAGGGLPPSPVSGIVTIQTPAGEVNAPFCVGCPSPLTGGNTCTSALAACKPTINVPAIRRRDYWYQDSK